MVKTIVIYDMITSPTVKTVGYR